MRDIESIIESLTGTHPEMTHEQLRARHPGADDDGLWFFRHPRCPYEVQLESATGQCPFLIETSARHPARIAGTVDEAVDLISLLLDPSSPQLPAPQNQSNMPQPDL
jgi:hypothetical protein